ncbi:MAG: RNA pyrophosphohydrolase [Pseudomonadota bacterium]
MIDENGFRANVGMVVCNQQGQLLWAKRVGNSTAWQFPQGGIKQGETPKQALYRELKEEVGLSPDDVTVLAQTNDWLTYHLPKQFQRKNTTPLCIGQKQQWFLLLLESDDSAIELIPEDPKAEREFIEWCWVDYWYPVKQIISFKKDVYQQFLSEFEATHIARFS